jgi:hypothetical protein
MRDAPRIIIVGWEAIVCKAMAPECTVPIRTGRRATTRLARNIPRAVALSKKGWGSVHQRQATRGAVSPMKKANGPADLQLL